MVVGRLAFSASWRIFWRVNHPAAQIEHRAFGGVNHRRRFAHAQR
jgi:hypothetical protein